MKKIAIIGLGYVGLPLTVAIALKRKDLEIIGFDVSKEKIQSYQKGDYLMQDDFLKENFKKVGDVKYSYNSTDLQNSDIFIIAVPTPVKKDFTPDFKYIYSALDIIIPNLKKDDFIVLESTVNPGVCDEIIIPYIEEKTDFKYREDFNVAHCPERINPGDEKWNVTNIPRNISANFPEETKVIADFYRSFINAEIQELDKLKEVESTKILENSFRDVNIAFVNEIAKSFSRLNINVLNVIKGASNKPFAFMPHYPGCGVGGHCIPVDPYYLIEKAKNLDFEHSFLLAARKVNNEMPKFLIDKTAKVLNSLEKSIKGTKITLCGLSYKANIFDLRESPAIKIKEILEKEYQAKIKVFEPYSAKDSDFKNMDEVVKNSELIIIATNHKEFVEFDFQKNKGNLIAIVDGRNCLNPEKIADLKYVGIGIN